MKNQDRKEKLKPYSSGLIYPVVAYNLQFFAKDGPGGEKTEPATPKKLNESRENGQVAKSKELIMAISLLALFIITKIYVGNMGEKLINTFKDFYNSFDVIVGDSSKGYPVGLACSTIGNMFISILNIVVPILLIAAVISILGNMLQQSWKVTAKPMKPKLSKISPLSGFKRIFSVRQLLELLKSIAMITIIGIVVYTTIIDKVGLLLSFYDITLYEALATIGEIIIDLGIKISMIFLIIGFIDLIYQRHKFKEDTKMTKQEVKDEYKNAEGDPQIRAQIKQKMREASQRRMMQSLPQADVVITNPTHYAVAVKYDPEVADAPYVLAKGEDFLAQRIKETAKANNIEIVENKPLARMLYHNVDVGAVIPPELYHSVAEVLAFVYNLKNKV